MPEPLRTLAWPVRMTPAGQLASVRVGSASEIRQAVDMVASIPAKSVRALPDLGRPELAFSHDKESAAVALEAAIVKQEPRAVGHQVGLNAAGEVDVDTSGVRSVSDDTTVETQS